MKKLIIIVAFIICAASLKAEDTHFFQASLTPDIAIYPKTTEIHGITLHVWGENPQQSLNLGFVNGSTGDSGGLSWGLVNYADSYTGVQWGVVNYSKNSFIGWQDGWINYNEGYFKGLQSGLVNVSADAHGLQLGCFNYADTLNGVQIGFINVINSNGWFDDCPDKLAKGFPIVNWSF
jgi:hypothetical protein